MINKKRLAMIAVAASMVLPTNLAYLSVATPVFAEEASAISITNDSFKDPEDTTKTKFLALTTGSYELGANLEIANSIVINADQQVTLNLNNHNITSTAASLIYLYPGAELTVEGTGSIKYTGSQKGAIFYLTGANNKLTLGDDITLESVTTGDDILDVHGIAILPAAKNSEVTIGKSTLKTATGISVNGLIDTSDYLLGSDKAPKITLNGTEINVPFSGIYQAGVSDITVTNCQITSTTEGAAIETRAGNLTVSGGTISGNTEAPLEVEANGSGATTINAGIAIAQHTTDKPINVIIKDNAKVSGYAALSIMDPQNMQPTDEENLDDNKKDPDIKINVEKATLNGNPYDVAYTENTIGFELNGTTVDENKIKQLDRAVETKTNDDGSTYQVKVLTKNDDGSFKTLEKTNPPYKLTPPATQTSSGGGHKKPTKPVEPDPEEPTTPVVGTPISMYRLYNRLTGEHLYTIDKNERDNLLTSDTWKDEGEGWIAPSVSDYPVYRLLNPNNGDHHYTTDKNEFDTLPTLGWVAEGVAFFSADKDNPENVLLHRLYNPNAEGAGSHHYTADTNERDTLVSQGWKYEGLAWAGLPANK